jgi:hypothetical protein
MAAKKSKRKATKKKAAQTNPFDARDKPIVYMTELERMRMDDEIGGMLEEGMIQDARDGAGKLLVAAAILALPTGDARLLQWGDEWGDGEGSRLSEHMVVLAGRALREGESARLDLVRVEMDGAGCTCTVTPGDASEHDDVDDILAPSLARDLDNARREADNVAVLWLVVLTTAAGARRVVHAAVDEDKGEGRSFVAQMVRRARRLKWLRAGERIERVRLDLRLSGTSTWKATVTADPVSVR